MAHHRISSPRQTQQGPTWTTLAKPNPNSTPTTRCLLKTPSSTCRNCSPEEEKGYHKGLKPRQIQMIAIGGAIGTGLFLGAGGRLATAGPGPGHRLRRLRRSSPS